MSERKQWKYVGAGYFRDASVPIGQKADIIHAPELVETLTPPLVDGPVPREPAHAFTGVTRPDGIHIQNDVGTVAIVKVQPFFINLASEEVAQIICEALNKLPHRH